MSRKARMPITIPSGVDVKVDGQTVTVKGSKEALTQEIKPCVEVKVADGKITVSQAAGSDEKNFLGLYWSLLSNMVEGVTKGFEKKLEMIGVGYRAAVAGNLLDVQVGRSHPTKLPIPQGLTVAVEKNTIIQVKGADKQKVGQFAADIRSQRPPEPYKGKGIRYVDEYVRRKAGKSGKK